MCLNTTGDDNTAEHISDDEDKKSAIPSSTLSLSLFTASSSSEGSSDASLLRIKTGSK